MRHTTGTRKSPGEKIVKDIKRATRKQYSSEEKIRIVLGGLRGDPTALQDLLDQIEGPVDLFLADGAYDGSATRDVLAARFGSTIEVTIPPLKNAILSPNAAKDPTARDCHIAEIAAHGRMAWQKTTGYNQRSRGETLMGRWKTFIGPKLKGRNFENQKTEAKIGVRVLNRMTELGCPSFERTA